MLPSGNSGDSIMNAPVGCQVVPRLVYKETQSMTYFQRAKSHPKLSLQTPAVANYIHLSLSIMPWLLMGVSGISWMSGDPVSGWDRNISVWLTKKPFLPDEVVQIRETGERVKIVTPLIRAGDTY